MKQAGFAVLFLFILKISFSQTRAKIIDSIIENVKTSKDDTSKVNSLIALSKKLIENGDLKQSLDYGNEALRVSEKLNFKKGEANAYNNIGFIFREQGNYSAALNNHLLALEIDEEIGFKEGVADSYIKIGNVYFKQDNYAEALKNYLLSLKIAEEIKDNQLMAFGYNNIGNIYKQQGNFQEGLKNYFAALRIYEETSDQFNIAYSYNNIGNAYLAEGNYAEALKNYQASLKIQETIGNKQGIAFGYINLGELYIKLVKLPEASDYLNKGLVLSKEIDDKQSIAVCYNNLGQLYMQLKKLSEAESYLNNGLQYSKEIGSKDLIKDNYYSLSELNTLKGDTKGAFEYYKLFSQMKDSILNEETNKQVSQLKIQYETDKKDQQIKTQGLQNIILQNRIYYGIAFSLAIIAIILLWFYFRIRKRKAAYEHTLVSLELTALKSQLNPHFISNSLSAIKSFIDKQPERASQFLSKFAKLMRHVLQQSELPSVSLKEELETTELYMQIESLRLKDGFDYEIICDPDIDQEMIIVPPLILQPTIENAIRHGLAPKEEKGKITIFVTLEDGLLRFTIEDNGVGKKHAGENVDNRSHEQKSFGLSITKKRIDIVSKELKKEGYINLKFLPGKTITELAFPVN